MFKERVKNHHRDRLTPPVMTSFEELEGFLKKDAKSKDMVVYFHVPYCDNICSFCSMNRTKLEDELDMYCDFLISQIDRYKDYAYIKQKSVESIYFGGGTPTVFKEKHLEKILNKINSSFNISKDVEYSFETTLHNLSINKIDLMTNLGVNRYSIGIQSFDDKGRKFLNRVGTAKQAIEKLTKIREHFSGNLCIDIIYNYPDQSVESILNDSKMIKELNIDSVSFYSLMYFTGSKLDKELDEKYYNLEQDRRLHNAFVEDLLKDKRFDILEYTKILQPKRDKYKYITLSHKGVDILPIGVGAGGRVGEYSMFMPKMGMQIITKVPKFEIEFDKFCNLFQYHIISLSEIKSYLSDDTFGELMGFFKKLEAKKYIYIENGCINFTLEGIFWGNTIAVEVAKIAKKDFIKHIDMSRVPAGGMPPHPHMKHPDGVSKMPPNMPHKSEQMDKDMMRMPHQHADKDTSHGKMPNMDKDKIKGK